MDARTVYLVAVIFLASPATASVLAGPYVNPANHHSYLLIDATSWTAAEAEAVTLGGHLVAINDASEQLFVYDTFSPFATGSTHLWIGLSDSAAEGTFEWTTGEPVSFTYWDQGEPNDGGSGEDYVEMRTDLGGVWNDNLNDPGPGSLRLGVVELDPLEVVEVPSDETSVSTLMNLSVQAVYAIVASGTFVYDNPPGDEADAQYLEGGSGNFTKRFNNLEFNETGVDAHISDIQNHRYTYFMRGFGNELRFRIVDANPSDNSGLLTVEIYPADLSPWAFLANGEGTAGFDYSLQSTGGEFFVTPASDGDGYKNNSDFLGDPTGTHLGEDWNGEGGGDSDCGDPVYAIGNGVVEFAGNGDGWGAWGNVVIVRHSLPDGRRYESLYGHVGSIAAAVSVGSEVFRNQQVGTIGKPTPGAVCDSQTGADCCHLHFEVRDITTDPSNPVWGTPGPGYLDAGTALAQGWVDPSDLLDANRSDWPECFDGIDDDGDGAFDHGDPGCRDPLGLTESPACDDGLDNDGDGAVDWDGGALAGEDTYCVSRPWEPRESAAGTACGLGGEAVFALAACWALRRRFRRRAGQFR